MVRLILLCAAVFVFNNRPQAQPGVEHFGVSDGLPQGFVTCIAQDREGFIWLGSSLCGMSRFDGQRFKQFISDPYEPNSLSENYVNDIADVGEYLFVGTMWQGANLFHKKTNRFIHLPFSRKSVMPPADPLAAPVLLDFLPSPMPQLYGQDKDGSLWIFCFEHPESRFWLCRMLTPPGFWERLPLANQQEQADLLRQLRFECWAKGEKTIMGFFQDSRKPFQLEGDRLLTFDGKGWQATSLPDGLGGTLADVVTATNLPGGTHLWRTFNNKLWKSYNNGSSWELLGTTPLNKTPALVSEHFAWVCSTPQLDIYPVESLGKDWSNPLWSLPVQDPRWIHLLDKSGNFWYATGVEGVTKFSPHTARFQTRMTDGRFFHPFFIGRQGVLTYTKDGHGFGIEGEPAALATKISDLVNHRELGPAHFKTDAKGRIWAGGATKLTRVDSETGEVCSYAFEDRLTVPNQFFIDENGDAWLTLRGILWQVSANGETLKAFTFKDLGLDELPVYSLAKTADGSLWLALEKGLLRVQPEGATPAGNITYHFGRQRFSKTALAAQPARQALLFKPKTHLYQTEPANRNSLRNNFVASLLNDPGNPDLLWIGTKGGGLNRFNWKTGAFTHLTTAEGLPDNVIYAVLSGGDGRLWLSSNKGLIRYDPKTGDIKSFRKGDGLQDDEFNTLAYGKSADGRLWFGGVKGMNVFDPKAITDNPNKPSVFITGLKINDLQVEAGDETGVLTQAAEFTESITLPFAMNSLTLEFAALEFTAPTKNRYRYWLEGFEEENAHEGYEPSANYIGLPPGKYTFIVYGSNNDGIWSDEPARLRIRVLPPWYRTGWAYLFYAAVLAGLIYWAIRHHRLEKTAAAALHQLEINKVKLEEFAKLLLEKSRLQEELQSKEHSSRELFEPAEQQMDSLDLAEETAEDATESAAANGHREQRFDLAETGELHRMQILTKDDWTRFQSIFENAYPGYLRKLEKSLPNLTAAEIRLVLLTKIGLGRKEIASMLGISPESVKKTSQRLRKKLSQQGFALEELFQEQ